MVSRRTVALVPIAVLSMAITSCAGCPAEKRQQAVRLEAQAKAKALKDQIDARFRVGSSQIETLAALKTLYEGRFLYTGLVEGYTPPYLHYWIVVAEQPSGAWFCDKTASVTVSADFKDGRYVGTSIQTVPHGCL